jgi:hypothetical protein
MTHRRRDRPWRVTVDSLSADSRFASKSLRTAHFGAGSSHGCGTLDGLAGIKFRRPLTTVLSPRRRPGIESP